MKYIRTKDGEIGIFRKAGDNNDSNVDYVSFKTYGRSIDNLNRYEKDYIQADTIEELCDEFVFIDEFFKREHRLAYSLENALALCKCHDVDITTLRGAIWTDKGLIYVAKMNEKGELELL